MIKIIAVIIILLISHYSYYGVLDENGEKVTDMQEILKMQNLITDEDIQNQTTEPVAKQEEEKQLEIATTEIKEPQEEIKVEQIAIKEDVTTKKQETKTTTEKTNTKKQETKTTVKNEPKTEKQEVKEEKIEEVPQKEEKQVIQEEIKPTEKKEETVQVENKTQENVTNKEQENNVPKCTENKHMMGAGNSGKWFDTQEQAVAMYESEIKKWSDKWTNYEIDSETYYKNCPDGYEVWTCPLCQKWTINLYY